MIVVFRRGSQRLSYNRPSTDFVVGACALVCPEIHTQYNPENQTGEHVEHHQFQTIPIPHMHTPERKHPSQTPSPPLPEGNNTPPRLLHTRRHIQPPGTGPHHVLKNVGESALSGRPMFSAASLVSTWQRTL